MTIVSGMVMRNHASAPIDVLRRASRCEECGAPTAVAPVGRPRRYCSRDCRRHADYRRRRIRRRQEALDAWQALLSTSGHQYSRNEIDRQINELDSEIYVLQHMTRNGGAHD